MNAEERFLRMIREGVDPDDLQRWLATEVPRFDDAEGFVAPLRVFRLDAGRSYRRHDDGPAILDPKLNPPVVSPVSLRLYTAMLLLAEAPTCGDFGLDCGLIAYFGARVVRFAHQASRPMRLTAREVIQGLPTHDDVAWIFSLLLAQHLLADAVTVPALEQAETALESLDPVESTQGEWVSVLESLAPQPVRASAVYGRLIERLSRPGHSA